jgi:hypothetical protein
MPTDICKARLRAVVRARVASFLGIQATKRNGIKRERLDKIRHLKKREISQNPTP